MASSLPSEAGRGETPRNPAQFSPHTIISQENKSARQLYCSASEENREGGGKTQLTQSRRISSPLIRKERIAHLHRNRHARCKRYRGEVWHDLLPYKKQKCCFLIVSPLFLANTCNSYLGSKKSQGRARISRSGKHEFSLNRVIQKLFSPSMLRAVTVKGGKKRRKEDERERDLICGFFLFYLKMREAKVSPRAPNLDRSQGAREGGK